jgi:hypothetical protein
MDHLDEHEMELEKTHLSGVEEWHCPTCGRRFLITWPPNYEKVILEPGNESVIHSGGKGGVRLQPPQLITEPEEPSLSEDLRRELEDFLDAIDIDGQLGPPD